MKNLFFVSVALGLLSGTSLKTTAQTSVNMEAVSTGTKQFAKNIKAIESGVASIENCTAMQFKYAQLLNVNVESITNLSLFKFIEEWEGTRYRYGGATRKGIDCSAYSGTLLHTVYGFVAARTARDQYESCEKIDRENLREGDLVFFNTRRGVSHVGVYLRNGFFTHASTGAGVTISNLDEAYYSKRYIGAGRVALNNNAEQAE
jgi:cell wall-associated NlpC family hydrolase